MYYRARRGRLDACAGPSQFTCARSSSPSSLRKSASQIQIDFRSGLSSGSIANALPRVLLYCDSAFRATQAARPRQRRAWCTLAWRRGRHRTGGEAGRADGRPQRSEVAGDRWLIALRKLQLGSAVYKQVWSAFRRLCEAGARS